MPDNFFYHIVVVGKVQGIGYRWFVQDTGRQCSLKGWVRNLSNGNVEIQASGTTKNLDTFIDSIRKSHSHARINNLIVEKILGSSENFSDFVIKF